MPGKADKALTNFSRTGLNTFYTLKVTFYALRAVFNSLMAAILKRQIKAGGHLHTAGDIAHFGFCLGFYFTNRVIDRSSD